MAIIKIEPVQTTTTGGYAAEITGIDPSDKDCILGTVAVPHGKPERSWDDSGICRDNPDGLNLKVTASEVSNVIQTIKAIQNNK